MAYGVHYNTGSKNMAYGVRYIWQAAKRCAMKYRQRKHDGIRCAIYNRHQNPDGIRCAIYNRQQQQQQQQKTTAYGVSHI